MRRFSTLLALACCVALLGTKSVSAQNGEARFASYSSMQEMVDRIESLEANLASYTTSDASIDFGGCGGKGCAAGCDSCCGYGHAIYAGAELVYAKPYFEDETETSDNESDYDYEASYRVFGGFRTGSGNGLRLRYWRWDHHSNTGNTSEDPFHLDVQALDAEFTKMLSLGSVDALIFGGARYGKVWHKDNDQEGMTFEGVGPTIGIDLMIPIECTNVSLLGGFRYSALFGQSRFDTSDKGDDDLVSGFDAQLGIQYSHCCAHGNLNLRATVEGQVWAGATDDPSNSLDDSDNGSTDEDLGFLGFGVGLEYVY